MSKIPEDVDAIKKELEEIRQRTLTIENKMPDGRTPLPYETPDTPDFYGYSDIGNQSFGIPLTIERLETKRTQEEKLAKLARDEAKTKEFDDLYR